MIEQVDTPIDGVSFFMAKTSKDKKTEKEQKEQAEKTSRARDEMSRLYLRYQDAKQELETRIMHKDRGFDVYDRVFRNYIEPSKWPFQVRVPDGRAATVLKRKTDRLIASKLQGKLIPRRAGSELGSRIGTELLLWQWTENDVRGDEPMLLKWRLMDLNCRKYGASFGFVGWDKLRDIPTFETLNNRDVLVQPGARSVENSDYVDVRRYVFLSELEKINKMSVTGPIYDPDAIKYIREKKMSNNNYVSVNRWVVGLQTGHDEKIELVTQYEDDKFITFCPMRGMNEAVALRAFKNPYAHKQKPLVRLVYDVIDDDIYGVPELENVLPLIKANWALLSQSLEATQNELYTPLMVNPQKVQVDTLNIRSGARWFMQEPGKDVVPYQVGTTALTKFKEHYALNTSLIMEGVGETGQDVSNISQTFADKTATEVKDMALLRSARDNANKLLLSQTIAKMIYFWFRMDQQFITGEKLVRITGKDALKYLVDEGLSGWTLTDEGFEAVSKVSQEQQIAFDDAYEILRENGALDQYAVPMFPIGAGDGQLPKLQLDKDGRAGFLSVGAKDLSGDYDFIPDVEAMSMPNDQTMLASRKMLFDSMLQVNEPLAQQGYQVKWKEVIEKLADTARVQDVEQFFEAAPATQQMPQQPTAQPMDQGAGQPVQV